MDSEGGTTQHVEPAPVKREVVEEDFLTEQDVEQPDHYLSSYGGSKFDDEWEAAAVVKHDVVEEEEGKTQHKRRQLKRATPFQEYGKKRQQVARRSRKFQEEESDPDYDESPRRRTRNGAKKTRPVKAKAAPKSRKRIDSDDSSETTPKKTISSHVPTSTPGKTRRKKVSKMTEEEREIAKAIWREQARERRQRQRLGEREDEDDFGDVKVEVDNKKQMKSSERRSSVENGGAKRTRKDKEEEREKNREYMAQKRKNMTPEEKEESLRKHRERVREKRAQMRASMTEEELEEMRKREAEKKRLSRMKMTPEQKRELYQKEEMRKILKLASMTEEEKLMWRTQKYITVATRMATLSKEEREERQQKRQEYHKRRNEQKITTEEDRQRRREQLKAYRDNMTPEQKERFREKLRRGYRNRVARLMQDKEKWAEENERRKISRRRWREKVKSLRVGREKTRRSRKQNDSKPKKESGTKREPKRESETKRKRTPNGVLTEEEKREKKNSYAKERQMKRRMQIKELLEKGVDLEEIKNKIETPEQRRHRLIKDRIKNRKAKLRKELQSLGAPQEEIDRRLKEVEETYDPDLDTRPFLPFKPRKILHEIDAGFDKKPKLPTLSGPGTRKTCRRTPKKQEQTVTVTATNPQSGRTTSKMYPPSIYTSLYTADPAGGASSSSSYVSTQEYQQYQGHLQQPQPSSSHHYHHQHAHLLPHQLPQSPPQAFDYSLQHILNGVAYQGPSNSGNQQYSYQYQHQTASVRPEYAPSYSNDSPPPSPVGGDDYGDDPDYSNVSNDNFPDPFTQASPPKPAKRRCSPNKRPPIKNLKVMAQEKKE